MKKVEVLAYAAGIFDGEGCIVLGKPRPGKGGRQLFVQVTNTEVWICEWLKFQFGGSIQSHDRKNKKWKKCYVWVIVSRQADSFLEIVLPYLNLKRPQAELAISFQKEKSYRARGRWNPLTEEERAVEEAQCTLLCQMKKKGLEEYGG